MALVLRTVKGSELTWVELDGNFTYLQDEIDIANTGSFLGTAGAGQVSFLGTASYAVTASYALNGGGGGGVTIGNNTNNNILTATGLANTLNGEPNLTFNGTQLSITGDLLVTGNTQLGDAPTDIVTLSATTMSLNNGALNIDSNTLYINSLSNTVGIGSDNNSDSISGTDYLKVVAGATTFGFSAGVSSQGFMSITNGTVTGYGAFTNNTDGMVFGATSAHSVTLRTSNQNRLKISSTGEIYLNNLTNTSYPNFLTYDSSTKQLNYISTSSFTASYAISSSRAISSSYAATSSYVLSASYAATASYVLSSSYAATSSYVVNAITASYVPLIKAGQVSAASFSGTPLTATVSFNPTYSNANYAVSVVGLDPRTWTVLYKNKEDFVIDSNSSEALIGNVYWIAVPYNS